MTPGQAVRTWLTVFLAVLIAGIGGAAAALWSQSANVTVQVATGTWADPVPSWALPPAAQVVSSTNNGVHGSATVSLTPPDNASSAVNYRVVVTPRTGVVSSSPTSVTISGSAPQLIVEVTRPNANTQATLLLTVTPELDGVTGQPSQWVLTVGKTEPTIARTAGS